MPAPKDNDFKLKFKTRAARMRLCREWCKHLRQGFSRESFPLCDPQTFKNYVETFPEDFDTEKIEKAERAGRSFWEAVGIKGAIGKIPNFNAASWIFNMKNRFGWRDRREHLGDPARPVIVNRVDFSKAVESGRADDV